MEAIGAPDAGAAHVAAAAPRAGALAPHATVPVYSGGRWHDGALYLRAQTRPGDRSAGPAVIVEANGTNVVEPGRVAEVTADDDLVLTRVAPRARRKAIGTEADPVMLEVFNNLFMSIAGQMA